MSLIDSCASRVSFLFFGFQGYKRTEPDWFLGLLCVFWTYWGIKQQLYIQKRARLNPRLFMRFFFFWLLVDIKQRLNLFRKKLNWFIDFLCEFWASWGIIDQLYIEKKAPLNIRLFIRFLDFLGYTTLICIQKSPSTKQQIFRQER